MSGTSLDGVDVALCTFREDNTGIWHYEIKYAKTYTYNNIWYKRLSEIHHCRAESYIKLHVDYAYLVAGFIKRFFKEFHCDADIIASHGHTVFHQPDKGFTAQLGCGATLAALLKKTVIADFRSMDVALKGQGAPLVPVGDKLLFDDYNYCINLGGFANISFDSNDKRLAFDICPVNIILNRLYRSYNNSAFFDEGGKVASKGTFNIKLFNTLNELLFYTKEYPKSLGREWLETEFIPVLNNSSINIIDKLNTVTHHIAYQTAHTIKNNDVGNKVLITGGGCYNSFLISCIKGLLKNKKIIIPDNNTIDFKEALIFAFLGLLRSHNEINCLKSVTGASRDSCCGAIYNG